MYTFVKTLRPEPKLTIPPVHYYQICTHKHPATKKFNLRHFVIDENNEFLSVRDIEITTAQVKKFYNRYKPHQYKAFSVYELDKIEPPSLYDINTSRSDILSTSGFEGGANF